MAVVLIEVSKARGAAKTCSPESAESAEADDETQRATRRDFSVGIARHEFNIALSLTSS